MPRLPRSGKKYANQDGKTYLDILIYEGGDKNMTQSTIDNELLRGSGIAGGKNRIYEFFTSKHTAKEKAAFLKKEYGWSGRSYCEEYTLGYDPKGMHFKARGNEKDFTLTWNAVAKRIDELIEGGIYLSDEVMK